MGDAATWFKALHIIFMVTWFAGLFYLPRLFVYHAKTTETSGLAQFELMEKRLFILMSIGMLLTIVFGVSILSNWPAESFKQAGWLHAKITLVILLVVYHHWLIKLMKELRSNPQRRSPRYYKWVNEVPTFFLIVIVLLAVLKPF